MPFFVSLFLNKSLFVSFYQCIRNPYPLSSEEIIGLLQHAIATDELLSQRRIELTETAALLRYAGGDARRALNILELVALSTTSDPLLVTDELVSQRVPDESLGLRQGR